LLTPTAPLQHLLLTLTVLQLLQLKMPTALPRLQFSRTTHQSQCHCQCPFSLAQLFFLRVRATTHPHHHHRDHRTIVLRTGLLPRRRDHHRHPSLSTSPSRSTSPGRHHHHHRSHSTDPLHPSHRTVHPSRHTDHLQLSPSPSTCLPSLSTTHHRHHHHHLCHLTSQSQFQFFLPTSPALKLKPGPRLNRTCPRLSASM
jgi:hypothetical protein